MEVSLDRLRAKLEKLPKQKHQMEEKYVGIVAHLLREQTQKGHDLSILTGIILNADQIIKEFPKQKEAWQMVGQKFLVRAKRTNLQSKRITTRT